MEDVGDNNVGGRIRKSRPNGGDSRGGNRAGNGVDDSDDDSGDGCEGEADGH